MGFEAVMVGFKGIVRVFCNSICIWFWLVVGSCVGDGVGAGRRVSSVFEKSYWREVRGNWRRGDV